MNYNKADIEAVIKLKEAGVPHRTIAEEVFGKRTSASSVWYILNEYYYDKPKPHEGARVLIFDIETAPEVAYVWQRWKANVAPVQVIQRSFMLSWAAKWLGTDEVFADALPFSSEYEGDKTNDYLIVKSIWHMLDGADVVVAHNGIRFDLAYLNSRFIVHNLGMPSPYKVVDTLQIAKKYFRFPANSLKELIAYLGVEEDKLDTNFQLWDGCMKGDLDSWHDMVEYNKRDITTLEQVYLKLRPYDKGHANVALYYPDEHLRCPCCGSTNLQKLDKNAYTAMSAFESYRCECKHVMRSNKKVKGVKIANVQ